MMESDKNRNISVSFPCLVSVPYRTVPFRSVLFRSVCICWGDGTSIIYNLDYEWVISKTAPEYFGNDLRNRTLRRLKYVI